MTLERLKQFKYIKKTIELYRARKRELENRLLPGAVDLNGMPRSPSPKNQMEEIVPLIADLDEQIRKELEEYELIYRFIESAPRHMYLILVYKFKNELSWPQVALRVGGKNTAESVKKSCYRYLEKSEKGKK